VITNKAGKTMLDKSNMTEEMNGNHKYRNNNDRLTAFDPGQPG